MTDHPRIHVNGIYYKNNSTSYSFKAGTCSLLILYFKITYVTYYLNSKNKNTKLCWLFLEGTCPKLIGFNIFLDKIIYPIDVYFYG